TTAHSSDKATPSHLPREQSDQLDYIDGLSAVRAMPGLDGYYVVVTHSGVTLSPFLGACGSENRFVILEHRDHLHADVRVLVHDLPGRLDAAAAGHREVHQHDI